MAGLVDVPGILAIKGIGLPAGPDAQKARIARQHSLEHGVGARAVDTTLGFHPGHCLRQRARGIQGLVQHARDLPALVIRQLAGIAQ